MATILLTIKTVKKNWIQMSLINTILIVFSHYIRINLRRTTLVIYILYRIVGRVVNQKLTARPFIYGVVPGREKTDDQNAYITSLVDDLIQLANGQNIIDASSSKTFKMKVKAVCFKADYEEHRILLKDLFQIVQDLQTKVDGYEIGKHGVMALLRDIEADSQHGLTQQQLYTHVQQAEPGEINPDHIPRLRNGPTKIQRRLAIFDACKTQRTKSFISKLREPNVIPVFLPVSCSQYDADGWLNDALKCNGHTRRQEGTPPAWLGTQRHLGRSGEGSCKRVRTIGNVKLNMLLLESFKDASARKRTVSKERKVKLGWTPLATLKKIKYAHNILPKFYKGYFPEKLAEMSVFI
uniref:Uncharacterized protein n=1 Tax=Branchiostoma floridae TaxID=7739 RepID=C3YB61_BRAFL|eukprot:XP_002606513.1 hypothetical protein BRAFLDRAFT_91903 [Branchiostoma floridae]